MTRTSSQNLFMAIGQPLSWDYGSHVGARLEALDDLCIHSESHVYFYLPNFAVETM